ncbi:hypothetical protein HYH03_010144 [Edaphochlamys debaryana]|uniref:Uncharacterized protein n=1 Tax=Edaphochlamys debaryana TaxID=47281 RepID=A0A836BWC3_9CHLO|nr:hypothetical protein HYH03_010144 [Edaphochlamys debaryana]|eukprot:KAG2491576.1 hypothetical protein HYH03_010144 [Edaphochlamys debaryana]
MASAVTLDLARTRHHRKPRADLCLVPFLGAPLDACRRITELVVRSGSPDDALSGAVLLALLPRLPQLRTLRLLTPVTGPAPSLDEAVAAAALDTLPHLTTVQVQSFDWLSSLSPRFSAQLTWLEALAFAYGPDDMYMHLVLAAMTSLRHVTLDAGTNGFFHPSEVLEILDALPPSVEHLCLRHLEVHEDLDVRYAATCRLAGGTLTEVVVEVARDDAGDKPTAQHIADFQSAALLPSRALGPRLQRLDLRVTAYLGDGLVEPDELSELLARCDAVSLAQLKLAQEAGEGAKEAALLVALLFGVPEQLQWNSRVAGTVPLRQPSCQTDGAGPGSAGSQGSGGAERQWPHPPLALVPVAELVERAVLRMAASAPAADSNEALPDALHQLRHGCGRTADGSQVLLTGKVVQELLAADTPEPLAQWVRELADGVMPGIGWGPDREPLQRRIGWLEVLPSAGALVLTCGSAAAAQRVRGELRRMLRQNERGAWSFAWQQGPLEGIDLVRTPLPLDRALVQELQALWDGAEGGAPSANSPQSGSAPSGDTTGAHGSPGAGPGGSSGDPTGPSPGPQRDLGGTRSAVAVEQLRSLLEAWEGLRALPPPQYLDARSAAYLKHRAMWEADYGDDLRW